MALINGNAYDWASITVRILGAQLLGIKSVTYTEEQEKQNNFGKGSLPQSRGRGRIELTGTLGLTMEEVEPLRKVAPNGSLLQISPFTVIVTFTRLGQETVTHTLRNVEFLNDGTKADEGDSEVVRDFGIIIGSIDRSNKL